MATIDLPISDWNTVRSDNADTVYQNPSPWIISQSPPTFILYFLPNLTNAPDADSITKIEFFYKIISHDTNYMHYLSSGTNAYNPATLTWNNGGGQVGATTWTTGTATLDASTDGSIEITSSNVLYPSFLIQNGAGNPTNTTFNPATSFIRVTYTPAASGAFFNFL